MQKIINLTAIILTGLTALLATSAGAQTADEILARADEIRAPSGSYTMQVSVESTDAPTFEFDISIGGKEASLIRTKKPAREIGKNYLMHGEDMWAYIPNIRRSMRVTLNQKLTGQASNGDISRMRWHGDYAAVVESETPDQWVLFLTAAKKGLTYEKIRVWIDRKTYRPVKGEYLTLQGKPIKFITFAEYAEIGGAVRPVHMVITSATRADDQSVLRILGMRATELPASLFTQNNLK